MTGSPSTARLKLADLASANGLRESKERSAQGIPSDERLEPATPARRSRQAQHRPARRSAGDALGAATLPRLAGPGQRCP